MSASQTVMGGVCVYVCVCVCVRVCVWSVCVCVWSVCVHVCESVSYACVCPEVWYAMLTPLWSHTNMSRTTCRSVAGERENSPSPRTHGLHRAPAIAVLHPTAHQVVMGDVDEMTRNVID